MRNSRNTCTVIILTMLGGVFTIAGCAAPVSPSTSIPTETRAMAIPTQELPLPTATPLPIPATIPLFLVPETDRAGPRCQLSAPLTEIVDSNGQVLQSQPHSFGAWIIPQVRIGVSGAALYQGDLTWVHLLAELPPEASLIEDAGPAFVARVPLSNTVKYLALPSRDPIILLYLDPSRAARGAGWHLAWGRADEQRFVVERLERLDGLLRDTPEEARSDAVQTVGAYPEVPSAALADEQTYLAQDMEGNWLLVDAPPNQASRPSPTWFFDKVAGEFINAADAAPDLAGLTKQWDDERVAYTAGTYVVGWWEGRFVFNPEIEKLRFSWGIFTPTTPMEAGRIYQETGKLVLPIDPSLAPDGRIVFSPRSGGYAPMFTFWDIPAGTPLLSPIAGTYSHFIAAKCYATDWPVSGVMILSSDGRYLFVFITGLRDDVPNWEKVGEPVAIGQTIIYARGKVDCREGDAQAIMYLLDNNKEIVNLDFGSLAVDETSGLLLYLLRAPLGTCVHHFIPANRAVHPR